MRDCRAANDLLFHQYGVRLSADNMSDVAIIHANVFKITVGAGHLPPKYTPSMATAWLGCISASMRRPSLSTGSTI